MNKNQSKYFNTAAKMDEALITLLEKKEFAYITVKEICEAAGVNRSTFYLHYENTSDLLKEATRYILERFLSYFHVDEKSVVENISSRDLSELNFITPAYILPYLTFIKDNGRIFKTAIKELGTMGFEKVYKDMYRHIFDPILFRFGIPEEERTYMMRFYLSGVTSLVMEWLSRNCRESIDDISRIIVRCVMGYAQG